MKSFKEISWVCTEPEYRADPALSYSTLAKYEREGFNNLDKLFDKVSSPSLTFGSAVDTLITGSEEEFNELFFVAEFPDISDSVSTITKDLFNRFSKDCPSLSDIPKAELVETLDSFNFQKNWREDTRARVFKERASEYYNLLYLAGDKTIMSEKTYNRVKLCVDALKTDKATRFYFSEDNPFDGIERLYQLKFKAKLHDIDYRCMADLIVVNHNDMTVQPVDLKTSAHKEWEFYKSFIDWSYHIQARLYWRLIHVNMMNDALFCQYRLLPYKFIVVNNHTDIPTPLVWTFRFSDFKGLLTLGKYRFRDPEAIGSELHKYLTEEHKLPLDIQEDNDIVQFIYKYMQ